MFSLQFTLDTTGAEQRLEDMQAKIATTATEAMPVELVAWQEEDMKRQYANVEITGWSAMTRIWPRSRKTMVARKRSRFGQSRVLRGLRPILRLELFDKLKQRMQTMLETNVTWR